MTDHTDLIARLVKEAQGKPGIADLDALLTEAADALADSVPREQYDALVHVIEQVREAVEVSDDGFMMTDDDALAAVLEAAPSVSLAQHDAEVWDEGAEYSVGYSTAPLYDNPYREETS
jgi:hypothetical protein